MNKLLRVSGKRLIKDRVFLLAIAVTLLLSLYISLTNAPAMAEWALAGDDVALEDCYYNLTPILGLICAAFVSLFLGVEQSDGTLRNKLIAGHGRSTVLLSFFIISALGCLAITATCLIGGLPGLHYFGFSFGWRTYAALAILLGCSALLYAAIFTAMSVLIPNKAVSAVASLVLWFIMLFVGSILVNSLAAPEMTSDYVLQNGNWVVGAPYPNPDYISGVRRTVFEFFNHIIPTCPAIRISNNEYAMTVLDIVYTLGATAVILIFGCLVFRKKDLK